MPLPELDPPLKEKSLWEKITRKRDPAEPKAPPPAPAPASGTIQGAAAALRGRKAQIDKAVADAEGPATPQDTGVNKGELGKKWNDTFHF